MGAKIQQLTMCMSWVCWVNELATHTLLLLPAILLLLVLLPKQNGVDIVFSRCINCLTEMGVCPSIPQPSRFGHHHVSLINQYSFDVLFYRVFAHAEHLPLFLWIILVCWYSAEVARITAATYLVKSVFWIRDIIQSPMNKWNHIVGLCDISKCTFWYLQI